MPKIKKFITNPLILIILSAAFSALPLTFDCLFLLSWVSFAPLFYVSIKKPPAKIIGMLGRGLLFGFIYHCCIYFWFATFYPLDFAEFNRPSAVAVVCLGWFGISLVHGLLWCIPTLLSGLVQKKIKSPLILLAVLILGIMSAQKLTEISELAFPWVRVSLGQYRATALIQSASVFGIDGVDMIILAVNALLALMLIYPVKKRRFAAAAAVTIFIANLGFGLIRLNTDTHSDDSLNILTVQGSIDKSDKWGKNGDDICLKAYQELTRENITDQTKLVIWPESAVPGEYKSDKKLKPYKKLSKEIGTPLLAGILKNEDGIKTNNALLINGDQISDPYLKRVLVPFGEYMPYSEVLSKIFPFLNDLNVLGDDYTAGTDSALIDFEGKKIGNVICFESIYPHLARESTADGAELLIEITNDSWLGDSPAMKQHLAHSVFRCVENSRWLVRSANSGISATVDSRGRIKKELGVNIQGVIDDTVYFENTQTPYTVLGDILFPIYAVTVVLACVYLITIKIYRDKKIKAF